MTLCRAVVCLLLAACADPASAEEKPVAFLFPQEAGGTALAGFTEGLLKAGV